MIIKPIYNHFNINIVTFANILFKIRLQIPHLTLLTKHTHKTVDTRIIKYFYFITIKVT